jgi:hypothetical protein
MTPVIVNPNTFVRTPDKRKDQTGFTGLKTGLSGFLANQILNPVNPEESC